MKLLTRFFNTVFLSAALAAQAGAVDTDLLDLANRQVDDTSLGTDVIVKEAMGSGKYVTGITTTGQIPTTGQILKSLNIGMESEIELSAYLAYNGSNYIELFLLADELQIKVTVNYRSVYMSGNALTTSTTDASEAFTNGAKNKIRLVLTQGTAKIYVNDVFSQKATLRNPSLIFTQIRIGNISPDTEALFDLRLRGSITTALAINLINISTRAPILGGANNPIAGFVVSGSGTQKVMITARGKSVNMPSGVCQDTTMSLQQLVNGSWTEIANNDDWQEDSNAGNVPTNFRTVLNVSDAALRRDLTAGTYTAIMGCIGGTGVGLIGVDVVP